MNNNTPTIWTIGHSTRPLKEFLGLLHENGIEALADVRRFAGSRKYPHFNPEPLRAALAAIAVEYVAFPELGGRRHPRVDSHNTVWRNEAFRGYADYMETPEFAARIERLLQLARRKHTAVMCAEAVWWRCHRSLIADYLKVRGIAVRHIMSAGKTEPHPYTSAASVRNGVLSYVPDDLLREGGEKP
ncbi:MAG: DUF488 domain-containing protein [Proteobacteria bacterium]|nr:DUF488 domain-containing protein [Pseudomonadota bacterium]